MMKDADVLTLKAFLAALCQQRSPLSDTIKGKLADIARSPETRIGELDDVAIANPPLKIPYKNARLWLTSTAAERQKGLKILPLDNADDDNNQETSNSTRNIQEYIVQMAGIIERIESQLEQNQIDQEARILVEPDPVNSAKNKYGGD
jgi:hypothetical protein